MSCNCHGQKHCPYGCHDEMCGWRVWGGLDRVYERPTAELFYVNCSCHEKNKNAQADVMTTKTLSLREPEGGPEKCHDESP